MFKKKEIEQELERASQVNAKLEEYQKAYDVVEGQCENFRVELDQIAMSSVRMDNSLTKVVDNAKSSISREEENEESLSAMTEELLELLSYDQKVRDSYATLGEQYGMQQEALLNLMEQSKHYTNITKHLSEVTNEYQQSAETINVETDKMLEYGKSMGVLALNSAIEAGRMGESGMQYIKAAEDIRDYAEQYETSAQSVAQEIDKLKESYHNTADEVHQLIVLLKENNVLLNKLTLNCTNQVDKMKQEHIPASEDKIKVVNQKILNVQKNSQEVLHSQKYVLGEMESIGACYMEEQDSTKKMEASYDVVKKALNELE